MIFYLFFKNGILHQTSFLRSPRDGEPHEDAELNLRHKSPHAIPWRPIFIRFRAIFIFPRSLFFFLLTKIFIFCPYSHSRGILGVFHHASGPSIMVYHTFLQSQPGPLSELTTERFPWPCHVENHMYFVYITKNLMIFQNLSAVATYLSNTK